MWIRAVLLAGVLALVAPPTARSADLVVWWEKGYYAQEDAAIAEIVAAFEQQTGKQVELVQLDEAEMVAALEAGRTPDLQYSVNNERWIPRWAYEDQLANLEGALGPVLDLFDADVIEAATLLNGSTGRRGVYALPMGRVSNHIHVWNSILERAGFTLAAIPKSWEAFWTFWCDEVQPAVRRALGRDDIWGVGLPMSNVAVDTQDQLLQFQLAYEAPWIDRSGWLQVDDPTVRAGLIQALDAYTGIYRKGCAPPDAVRWGSAGNNEAFLAQRVVMTPNYSLSIPPALRAARPDDYLRNAVTIDWPADANGQPLVIGGFIQRAVVFKAGGNTAVAEEFVRFLVEDGWLAHWLNFAGDRLLPPMRQLVEQPFWLDPRDPHRMHAAMQILTRPHQYVSNGVRDHEWRSSRISDELVWGRAVHRVVTEGISPERAVDEAIARIKQILSE